MLQWTSLCKRLVCCICPWCLCVLRLQEKHLAMLWTCWVICRLNRVFQMGWGWQEWEMRWRSIQAWRTACIDTGAGKNRVACSQTQMPSGLSYLGSSLMLKCHIICQVLHQLWESRRWLFIKGSGPVASSRSRASGLASGLSELWHLSALTRSHSREHGFSLLSLRPWPHHTRG